MGKIFKDTPTGLQVGGGAPKSTTNAKGGSGAGAKAESNDQKTYGMTPSGATKVFSEDAAPTEKKMGSLLGAVNTIEKPTKI